jgi:hypothetical protein
MRCATAGTPTRWHKRCSHCVNRRCREPHRGAAQARSEHAGVGAARLRFGARWVVTEDRCAAQWVR